MIVKISSLVARWRSSSIFRIGVLMWALLCAAGTAEAVSAYVQGNSRNDSGTYTTVPVPFTGAQTAGNLNVVIVGYGGNATVASISDSRGNTYAQAVGPTSVIAPAHQYIYYAKNIVAAAAGANTITINFSSTIDWPSIRIAEYSGMDTVSPLDVAGGATGTGTEMSSGAVTTTLANDLLVGGNFSGTYTASAGAGFTQRIYTFGGEILEDRIVSSTGSYAATGTLDSSIWWIMQVAAFKAAAAGGDTQAPSAPTSLTATAVGPTQVNLTWTGATDNVAVTGYLIERCAGSGCTNFVQIDAIGALTSFADTTVAANTLYRHRVRARDAADNRGGYSNVTTVTTPTTSSGSTAGAVTYEYDSAGRMKRVTVTPQ